MKSIFAIIVKVFLFVGIVAVTSGPLFPCCLWAQPNYLDTIREFKNVVEKRDPKMIASRVAYPLSRRPPLPPIKDSREFVKAFDEVLDEQLLWAILSSDMEEDWAEVGSRGIMFRAGILWLNEEGKIIAVNYETKKGMLKSEAMIEADKKTLHGSLQQFKEPVLEWKTKDFRIRVDEVGDDTFRYAAWPAAATTDQKPDLILEKGKVHFEGSGGNHHYEFKSGPYRYRCYVWVVGPDDMPPGELEVSKRGKIVLTQPVKTVITGR